MTSYVPTYSSLTRQFDTIEVNQHKHLVQHNCLVNVQSSPQKYAPHEDYGNFRAKVGTERLLPVWPDGEIIFPIFGHLLKRKYAQWPQRIPKVGSKIGQILKNLQKITKYFKNLAKVAKFHQVWSHWFLLMQKIYSSNLAISPFLRTIIYYWLYAKLEIKSRKLSRDFIIL